MGLVLNQPDLSLIFYSLSLFCQWPFHIKDSSQTKQNYEWQSRGFIADRQTDRSATFIPLLFVCSGRGRKDINSFDRYCEELPRNQSNTTSFIHTVNLPVPPAIIPSFLIAFFAGGDFLSGLMLNTPTTRQI